MRRLLALAACLLLLAPFSPVEAQRRTQRRAPKKESQLRRDLARVRSQKERIRRQLRATRRAASAVLDDIKRVDSRITEVQEDLTETTARLGATRKEQKRVASELKAATENLEKARERVRARLKRIYMRGPSSTLSAFIGTRSSGDLASRAYLLQAIAKKDREVFNEYRRLRFLVSNRKQRVDELVEEISGLAERQRVRKAELGEVRREKGNYLSELRQRAMSLEEALRQFEADERQIQGQIAAFLRSRRRGGRSLPPFIGRFLRPVNASVSSGFGMRFHPILRVRRLHAGVDFRASSGTPIKAAADGEVIASQSMRGYGNVVILDHGGGISTVYAHCSRLYVGAGQRVAKGQVIAAVGSTGLSTAPHLHWEVRVNGRPVNPMGRL